MWLEVLCWVFLLIDFFLFISVNDGVTEEHLMFVLRSNAGGHEDLSENPQNQTEVRIQCLRQYLTFPFPFPFWHEIAESINLTSDVLGDEMYVSASVCVCKL